MLPRPAVLGALTLLLGLSLAQDAPKEGVADRRAQGQAGQTRLGLISGGRNPVTGELTGPGLPPPTGGILGPNKGLIDGIFNLCPGGDTCCCVEQQLCHNSQIPLHDGSGNIDLRFVNKPAQPQCAFKPGLVFCCQQGQSIIDPAIPGGPGGLLPGGGGQSYFDVCGEQACCCTPDYVCQGQAAPHDGSGLIDLRLSVGKCAPREIYCCLGGAGQPGASHVGDQVAPFIGCGVKNPLFSNHLPGQADYGEYPWQVVILDQANGFVAGGVIIDEKTILTVGHRVLKYSPDQLKVRVGDWDVTGIYPEFEYYPSLEHGVGQLFVHPQINVKNSYNNIALLQLLEPIFFNSVVSPICLPQPGQFFYNQRCWVTGWGKNAFGPEGKHQAILKEVDVTIHDPRQCEFLFRTNTNLGPGYVFNPEQFVCAGGEPGKDACVGDGGGPLVCENPAAKIPGQHVLVGLAAWGKGCGQPGVPGAYMNMQFFMPWVYQTAHGYAGGHSLLQAAGVGPGLSHAGPGRKPGGLHGGGLEGGIGR